ncbi:hypothetical protein METBIDRAFT_179466 [Metschnikowia bicuspidata var. bicuspidata NRRL YB-4993]|uniref:Uncharacterized protein n=1 Tax=Metschnikowia bicuspidata var. bicuspidata NRRL YB-4993 TaxID=869754 RepID=A0A1A0HBL0_9ASCO|nr:hypothetical protein METBIDRAFT_179466 [Metschnikowia bicuspidata var. bicuspidata NRRL YB-4993]OBA21273.1 hypothetical protein METBIDRAFT_179466 [Metschnikowia bicuspidata var. bicuspidata NRRL YB-4993]
MLVPTNIVYAVAKIPHGTVTRAITGVCSFYCKGCVYLCGVLKLLLSARRFRRLRERSSYLPATLKQSRTPQIL